MKRKRLIIFISLVLLALLAFLLWTHPQNPLAEPAKKVDIQTESAPSKALPATVVVTNRQDPLRTMQPDSATPEERKVAIAEIERRLTESLTSPIEFYGKVVDQSNQPVANAQAHFNAQDKFDASGSTYQRTSDENGLFSISNIKGAALGVGVGKEGYYSRDKAHGIFNRAGNPPTTRDNPAVFVLVKMGETEPLIKVSQRQFELPKDGTPIFINFTTGKKSSSDVGNLKVESWLGDTTQRKFDWHFRWSIPSGGLIERTNVYAFEAPVEGYQPFMEASMTTNVDRWLSEFEAQHFAKFPNGTYARFFIRLYPGKRNFVVLESYLNPIPGHRNLELDPKKLLK